MKKKELFIADLQERHSTSVIFIKTSLYKYYNFKPGYRTPFVLVNDDDKKIGVYEKYKYKAKK
jgi:hypothetical protein